MAPGWIEQEFDRRAPSYDGSSMHHSLAWALAQFCGVIDTDRVLDIATGTGLVLRSMEGHRPTRMTGVDISERMLEVAEHSLPEARWVQADAGALPFASGEFDLVTCAAALPYLPNVDGAVNEWKRVLVDRGRIVLSAFTTDGITGPALVRRAAGVHGLVVEDPNEPWGSTDALHLLASRCGMRIRRSSEWSTPVPSSSADDLIASRYPLARDDLVSASSEQLEMVHSTLEELVRGTGEWQTTATIVELV